MKKFIIILLSSLLVFIGLYLQLEPVINSLTKIEVAHISLTASILAILSVIITIDIFLVAEFDKVKEKRNRLKALQSELHVNYLYLDSSIQQYKNERVPTRSFSTVVIENALKCGEVPEKDWESIFNIYNNLNIYNEILCETRQVRIETILITFDRAKQQLLRDELKKKLKSSLVCLSLIKDFYSELVILKYDK